MKSISTLVIIAATALVSNAIAAPAPEPSAIAYKTLTYKGCFSSGDGMTKNSTYTFNSKGYCQTQCVPIGKAVQATYNSNECWCGDDLPPSADLVSDSKCDDPCAGIDTEMCGGVNYWSVYLTGTENSAPNYDPASASASSAATATTSSVPTVVTVEGQTVTVSATDAAAASSSAAALANKKSSSSPSKAGIAAGVVVGVVAAAALAGGIFFFMRNKKRREVEEEYRRNAAVNNFVAGGKSPVGSAGGSVTDTRLDPTLANRRMSDGSIADNQDYSRRILKVTNA